MTLYDKVWASGGQRQNLKGEIDNSETSWAQGRGRAGNCGPFEQRMQRFKVFETMVDKMMIQFKTSHRAVAAIRFVLKKAIGISAKSNLSIRPVTITFKVEH